MIEIAMKRYSSSMSLTIWKELENLMHEISKPLHRPHVSGKFYTGYVVGGDEALAIVISKLP